MSDKFDEFRAKIIIGVDFGTTYSGLSYVPATGRADHARDPEIIARWAGGAQNESREKVYTKIAYAFENPSLTEDAWGFGVQPEQKSYSWFKLKLDSHTSSTEFDDPHLRQVIDSSISDLPPGKSAEDVAADFLTHLYKHCINQLEEKMTAAILALTPLQFWFTMPAIWSDRAKFATRAAAQRAGFGSRPGDEIRMITEPEAAAMAAFKSTTELPTTALLPNTGCLILDCGGGTVDITTYTIRDSRDGQKKLQESCVGIGGKCGSTSIDRNMYKLMNDRYGLAWTAVPKHLRSPGSRFMNEFEDHKRNFGSLVGNQDMTLRLRLRIEELYGVVVPQYDEEEREITLTVEDMKHCFDPVVDKILALIRQQIQEVRRKGEPEVNTIIQVGGFGDSQYLYRKVQRFCTNYPNLFCIVPQKPWSAIARGACLRGLGGELVEKRRCRRHYGTSLAYPYRPGIDEDEGDVYHHPYYKMLYKPGWMKWAIAKGETLTLETRHSIEFWKTVTKDGDRTGHLDLYTCDLTDAPDRRQAVGVEKVGALVYVFDEVSYRGLEKRKVGGLFSGKTYHSLKFELRVELVARSGVLEFVVYYENERCGHANIDFERNIVLDSENPPGRAAAGPSLGDSMSQLRLENDSTNPFRQANRIRPRR